MTEVVGATPIKGIEDVARGQKMLIYAIVVNFLAIGLRLAIGPSGALLNLVAILLALIGIFRIGTGMGFSIIVKILLVLLACIPLINLVVLLSLNSRATKKLRESGYKVGLLGASH